MKIKSRVWYWLAAASGAVSLLYGMGIEGGAQLGSSISDSQLVTALCLVLAAVAFLPPRIVNRTPAAMAALTAPTPVPKSRSTGKPGGAHEKQMSPPVLVTRTSPKGDGIHKPHHP